MQLYKSRDFNSFFSDSFEFVKLNGSHFFKHFFAISGALLIILAAISYIVIKLFFDKSLNTVTGNNFGQIEQLIEDNIGIVVSLGLITLIFVILCALIIYSFTPIYFKLYEAHGGANFKLSDIIKYYKSNKTKLLNYLGYGFLLLFPLGILMGISISILIVTIIGVIAIPLVIALFSSLYHMTLLELLDNKRRFLDSLLYVWSLIFSKFWAVIGSLGLMYIICYIVQGGIAFFKTLFSTSASLVNINPSMITDSENLISVIFILLLYFASFFISITLTTFIQISQSIIFYSLKDEKENINTTSQIDQIGNSDA